MKRPCNTPALILVIVRLKTLFLSVSVLITGISAANLTHSKRFDDWAPVHSYIVDHAVYVTPGAEEKFYIEAQLGIETWETFGGTKRWQTTDGRGNGWPATGEGIFVATEEEAATLAALIRQVTNGG